MKNMKLWEWGRKWAERFGVSDLESNGTADVRPVPLDLLEELGRFDLPQMEFFKEYLESEIAERTSRTMGGDYDED